MITEIICCIFCIWVVLKLILINHNISILADNQKILDKKLDKLLGEDKSILDDLFKEKR